MPKELKGPAGTLLAASPDGSILVTGTLKNGVYEIVAETDLAGITGIRLEALADDKLARARPRPRPERQLRPQRARGRRRAEGRPQAKMKPVKLQNPLASFSQAGLPIAAAIDGNAPPRRTAGRSTSATGP